MGKNKQTNKKRSRGSLRLCPKEGTVKSHFSFFFSYDNIQIFMKEASTSLLYHETNFCDQMVPSY